MKVEWILFTSTVCKCNFGVWSISQVDLYNISDGTGTPTSFVQMLVWFCHCVRYVTVDGKL